MKRTIVCLCAGGALCLLTILLPSVPASAQDMAAAMGGATSEVSTVSAASVTGGSGGMGGGSSEENRTVSHARSTVTSTLAYDALELTVDSTPGTALTVGGVTLELAFTAEDGAALAFTPSLIPWTEEAQDNSEAAERVEAEPPAGETALLLTAEDGAAGNWVFRGSVLRKLRNSGVSRLVLAAGGHTLALPTEGFLGGYRYDQWRSSGVAAKDIQYTLSMDGPSPRLASAAGDESHPAGEDTSDMLYYTGVTSQGAGVNNIE